MKLRSIKNYEGIYEVSNEGKIFSCERKVRSSHNAFRIVKRRQLKPAVNKRGYLHLTLANGNTLKTYRVHRLVAEAFVLNPLNLPQVNHKDSNKQNNNDWNLEWTTDTENRNHAIQKGIINQKGEKNAHAKLTGTEVLRIRKLYSAKKYKQQELADKFNVSLGTIRNITQGRAWKHL